MDTAVVSEMDEYLFDTMGYLLIKGEVPPAELALSMGACSLVRRECAGSSDRLREPLSTLPRRPGSSWG